jgi:hypothetical protein
VPGKIVEEGADLVHFCPQREHDGARLKALVVHSRAAKDKPLTVMRT